MSQRFPTIDEREGSWSTNSIQGYQTWRVQAIDALREAVKYFDGHLDFRAFEQVDKANNAIAGMKRMEAYANQNSNLLLEAANHIEALNKGVGVTALHDIVGDCRKAAMGETVKTEAQV